MKPFVIFVAVAGALVLPAGLVLATGPAGLLPYKDLAMVEDGARIYARDCAGCHGAQLQGAPGWRTRDAAGYLPAPPHDETGHTWHHPDAQLFVITKHGTAALVGGGYKSRMPGFGAKLSDAEILNVLAYIKSTWPPRVVATHDRINRESQQAD